MPEYGFQIPWVGAPFLALLCVVWSWKWRWAGALLLGVVGVGIGIAKGVLIVDDAIHIHAYSGLGTSLLQLIAWTLFAMVARAHGRLPFRGSPMWLAPLMGALMGELAAAAILSAGAKDRSAAARLALAAAGGGMIGRIGDSAVLTLWSTGIDGVFLALLGVGCVAVAAPRKEDFVSDRDVDPWVSGVCMLVAVLAVSREWATEGLVLGTVVLCLRLGKGVRSVDPRPLGWLLGSALLVLVALSGGTSALGGLGLSELQGFWGERVRMVAAGGGALLSCLTGGQGAALMSEAVLGRSSSASIEHLETAAAAGLAVGGLGPLVIAGALAEGWRRWLLQVCLVLVLCGVFLT